MLSKGIKRETLLLISLTQIKANLAPATSQLPSIPSGCRGFFALERYCRLVLLSDVDVGTIWPYPHFGYILLTLFRGISTG